MSIECKHGHLARSCYRCDDEREIARLRADVVKLREALGPFAKESSTWPSDFFDDRKIRVEGMGDSHGLLYDSEFTLTDIRRAAQAMDETNATG